ncbi:hypothetical protein [Aliiglaciecola lipolytica]|uniref:Uncharacterized protein n=1 Tax=Aliiglaciecola lipolytica E3 TaxID=1127673 RepID=K6YRE0_9ALTE|nr:hypothetical protein [Aliiglaciecola lipolytica]GAC13860.1 hypothetical protein GLIP_1219 [Aliiglaciecola lipolytica E3]
MSWLDSLLAFSVVMMILSTIVSAIVESFHNFLNQRAKGLERLMEQMFDKVIAPRLLTHHPQGMDSARFVKQMTDMRWLPIKEKDGKFQLFMYKALKVFRKVDKVEKLSTLEFLERLAETPVGKEILNRSKKLGSDNSKLGVFLEDLASKYEDYGDSASRYFAKRSRFISILVGFFLVFAINFNVVEVMKTLSQSEASRQALIQEGDRIANRLQAQLIAEEAARTEQETSEEFDLKADKIKQVFNNGMQDLEHAQLPIGWDFAPWNRARLYESQEDANNSVWSWIFNHKVAFLGWLLSVFASGLLVGLGGPFWFDTYKRLSSVSKVSKTFQSQVKQEENLNAEAVEQSSQSRAERFVNIFNTSREANEFAKATGRRLLNVNGKPMQQGGLR